MFCFIFLGLFVTKQNCFDALYWILLANLRFPSKSYCSSWVCKYESLQPVGSGGAYVSDGKSSDGEIPNVNPGSIIPNWSPGGFPAEWSTVPKGLLSLFDDTPLYSHMLYPYNFPADQSPCLLAFHPMIKIPGFSSHFSHDFPTISSIFPWVS